MSYTLLFAYIFARFAFTLAQTTNVTCPADRQWTYTQEHSPCALWAQIISICTNEAVNIGPAIHPIYPPPTASAADSVAQCSCNLAAYSLMAACSYCQSRPWADIGQWSATCRSFAAIPAVNFTLPVWAGVNQTWSAASALSLLNASTASSGSNYSSTSLYPASTQTVRSGVSSAVRNGLIGGFAALGGLVLLALLIALCCLTRRKKDKQGMTRVPTSSPPIPGHTAAAAGATGAAGTAGAADADLAAAAPSPIRGDDYTPYYTHTPEGKASPKGSPSDLERRNSRIKGFFTRVL